MKRNMVTVECGYCAKVLGKFMAAEDYGSIIIGCPHCNRPNELFNAPLRVAEADGVDAITAFQFDVRG